MYTIGNTVRLQYERGVYRIVEWSHVTNAHALPGDGVVEGLKKVGVARHRGLFLLAHMSSKGNLLTPSYAKETVAMAERHEPFVIGFIAQKRTPEMMSRGMTVVNA